MSYEILSVYPSSVPARVSPVLEGLANFVSSVRGYVTQKEARKQEEEKMSDIVQAQLDVYRLGGALPEWYERKSSAYKRAFKHTRGVYMGNELSRVTDYAVQRDPSLATDPERFNKMFWDTDKALSEPLTDPIEIAGYAEKVVSSYEALKGRNLAYQISLEKAYAERGMLAEIHRLIRDTYGQSN
jgi:hypothetical protein